MAQGPPRSGGDPKAQQCGWLQDKYGFSWQIIPTALPRLLNDPDKKRADRVTQVMLKMTKIDISALERA
jgi:predicted 3-demethylubiquinone-9 3-methyltransferase (glyoxalase superfamily)